MQNFAPGKLVKNTMPFIGVFNKLGKIDTNSDLHMALAPVGVSEFAGLDLLSSLKAFNCAFVPTTVKPGTVCMILQQPMLVHTRIHLLLLHEDRALEAILFIPKEKIQEYHEIDPSIVPEVIRNIFVPLDRNGKQILPKDSELDLFH
jgi:hypothetical protein